jgi:hypothetical protein
MASDGKVSIKSLELAVDLAKVGLAQSSQGVSSPDVLAKFIETVAQKIESMRRELT